MRFFLRSLLVLAIAVVFGGALYYAVQALPGRSANPPTGSRLRPEAGRSEPDRTAPRPEQRENDRGGFRLRSVLGVGWRVIQFSILVFFSVIAKKLIFDRRLKKRGPAD